MNRPLYPLAVAVALALCACSSPSETKFDTEPEQSAAATATADDGAASKVAGASPPVPVTPSGRFDGKVLALEGLDGLIIGQSVPPGSRFAERGAQTSETCRTVSSPDYPGVYAITDETQVRRITVGQRSNVKLREGIGVGSTEAEVAEHFPGFRSTAHKYAAAPAKYLTQPGNDPRLRFEIGEDGRVKLIHVGLMPELAYVEGCA